MLYPIIIAGGSGTRLWPLSRELRPKQFLKVENQFTMLENTLSRINSLECEKPLVVCNESHRFLVAESLRKLNILNKNVILEPVGKNTAPAIAIAALTAIKQSPCHDPLIFILPADHVIKDCAKFNDAITTAMVLAQQGGMVTFGIVPTIPETGFGYIKKGISLNLGSTDAFKIDSFIEKPCIDKAISYVNSGDYFWNSGMFMFKASRYLEELKKFRPKILEFCEHAVAHSVSDLDFIRVDKESFELCPAESVDYAVMENTAEALVVPLDAGWSDVGSWASLWEISDKDDCGNVNNGDVINYNSKNNYIFTDSGLVATIGISDLIIVNTKDALLVSSRSDVQEVKKIVSELESRGRLEHCAHREVFRPWGKYDSIDAGERYQVKRISVNPGESLSFQLHYHRAEHWIIVSGTACVKIGNQEKILTENESVYIPIGVKHGLKNPGKIPLELIEVRSGSYFEEDDVTRFADKYE